MMKLSGCIFLGLFTLTVAAEGPAMADNSQQQARAVFQKARALFKAGDYSKAVVELKRAYALKPHPALLRYLGQTYYKLNRAGEAIAAFKKYLKDAPQAPDRAAVEGKVRELEMVLGADTEDQDSAPPAVAPPPPTAAERPPTATRDLPTGEDNEVPDNIGGKNGRPTPRFDDRPAPVKDDEGSTSTMGILKWTSLGIGVGALGAGIAFAVLSASKGAELEDLVTCTDGPDCGNNPTKDNPQVPYQKSHHELLSSHKNFQTISIISFVAAGVLTAGAVTFFVLDKPKRRDEGKRSAWKFTPVVGAGLYGAQGSLQF
jgi:hypothetical protein